MDDNEHIYWALFLLSLCIVLGLLAWDPLVTKYRSWKLKRAFKIREEAGRIQER
jgi:hypothetical protein